MRVTRGAGSLPAIEAKAGKVPAPPCAGGTQAGGTRHPAGSRLRRAGSPPYPEDEVAGYAWRAEPFPPGEVQFPCTLDPHYSHYSKAAITHNIAADTLEKVEFTFGLYMRTFFCDPTGVFFSMLET